MNGYVPTFQPSVHSARRALDNPSSATVTGVSAPIDPATGVSIEAKPWVSQAGQVTASVLPGAIDFIKTKVGKADVEELVVEPPPEEEKGSALPWVLGGLGVVLVVGGGIWYFTRG